jgi:hypothetical protein
MMHKVIVAATLIAAALSSAGAFQLPASHVGLFSKSSLAARTLVTNRLRGGASCATMATFYDLAEKDAAGQMVKFDKFKGKVVYGVNVARYTYIHTHIQKYTHIYACAYTYE